MKIKTIVLAPALALLVAGVAQAQQSPSSTAAAAAPAAYATLDVEQMAAAVAAPDAFIVNVHVPFQGDIQGTDASIAFDQIGNRLAELPSAKNARIVLYCRSGRMSVTAAETLTALGYTNVSHLGGGFNAWEAAGRPLLMEAPR
jgi:rhodanese-related sulfurtransferase